MRLGVHLTQRNSGPDGPSIYKRGPKSSFDAPLGRSMPPKVWFLGSPVIWQLSESRLGAESSPVQKSRRRPTFVAISINWFLDARCGLGLFSEVGCRSRNPPTRSTDWIALVLVEFSTLTRLLWFNSNPVALVSLASAPDARNEKRGSSASIA